MIKSVVGLPQSYSGQCEVVVNDRDFDVTARNVILLLISLYFNPSEAPSMMLHVWYSAFIPDKMFRSLQDKILPLIQQVLQEFKTEQKPLCYQQPGVLEADH